MKRPTDSNRPHLRAVEDPSEDPELKRALAALAEDRPDPEDLARVRRRLQAALDQPAPSRMALPTALLQPRMLLLAGAVLLGATLIVPRLVRQRPSAPPPLAADSVVVAAKSGSSATDVEPAQVPAQPAAAVTSASAPGHVPHVHATKEHAAPPSAARKDHARSSSSSAVQGTEPLAAQPSAAQPSAAKPSVAKPSAAAPASAPSPAEDAPASASSVGPAQALVANEPTPEPKPRKPDEVTLLQQARRNASSDAKVALQFLEEHKRLYPQGTLSPEREVLAIELLRALGRDRDAEQRARAFQQQYPGSVYTPRVLRLQK